MVDLASMRDAIVGQEAQADQINPEIWVDLAYWPQCSVDFYGCKIQPGSQYEPGSLSVTMSYEFSRGAEKSFDNYRAVPPCYGTSIRPISNFSVMSLLKRMANSIQTVCFGTDSHTTMINGIEGVPELGCWWDWAGAAMLVNLFPSSRWLVFV